MLKNVRHEKFAQEVASGASQADAYTSAGFKPSNAAAAKANASRLIACPNIRARIAELQRHDARRAELRRDDIVRMLLEDRQHAYERGQIGPAVRATELLGKQLGIFVERREIVASPLDDLDFQSLSKLHDALLEERDRREKEGESQ